LNKVLVLGGGGFIGHHLVKKLKQEGCYVVAVDLKLPRFEKTSADEFVVGDLRRVSLCRRLFVDQFQEIYQLAADMGGAGYVFVGENDAKIVHNSMRINLNIAHYWAKTQKQAKLFFSSSACVYPKGRQMETDISALKEETAYPAEPDSEYGWEKLLSERLYLSHARNFSKSARIARLHNIFGPMGTWRGGKEKAPAAVCRKVAKTVDGGKIEIWCDGQQTRSFLYIDECLEGIGRLMNSDFTGPVNIGSSEMVSINDLAKMVIDISGKKISIEHIDGIQGVRGRSSDNSLIRDKLKWSPSAKLYDGLTKTYQWIESQVRSSKKKNSSRF
jgi:nucleoside-diphosphate-sugar epimerase